MFPQALIYGIGLIALLIATYTDIKKLEVPDFLNYSLIALGLCIGAVESLFSGLIWPFLNALAGLGAGFLVAALLYYTGQWGGGDAKMLMGLGALHGTPLFGAQSIIISWQWPLFFSIMSAILIVGCVYSLIYFFGLTFVKYKQLLPELKKVPPIFIISSLGLAILSILSLLLFEQRLGLLLFSLGLLMAGGLALLVLARIVQEKLMIQTIPVSKLVPGDWLEEKIPDLNVGKTGLTENNIAWLQKHRSEVQVKMGIPFIPGFLLGYLSIVIFDEWILLISVLA